jgi:hypothetical protein
MLRVYAQRVTKVLAVGLMVLARHLTSFVVWVSFACFAACVRADEV